MRSVFGAALGVGVVVGLTGMANSEPRLEATGFFGVDDFGPKIGLGNSTEPEQRPQTSAMFGARVTYVPLLGAHLSLAVEAELAMTPSFTGYGFVGPRDSYFAPVFGYRGAISLRFEGLPVRPHLDVGAGGATVVSASPYMSSDTEPVVFWGPGVTLFADATWHLRIDLRQTFMPAQGGGTTATYEGLIGIGTTFGKTRNAPPELEVTDLDHPAVAVAAPVAVPVPVPVPAPVPAAAPDPTRDTDADGIPDITDACPTDPETVNGWQDEDGCPDQVPAEITAAFIAASAVRFETGRARLTPAAKHLLDQTLAIVRDRPKLRIAITSHRDAGGDELAHKRAEAVKWYLVEQGVAADQVVTVTGDVAQANGPTIELMLIVT